MPIAHLLCTIIGLQAAPVDPPPPDVPEVVVCQEEPYTGQLLDRLAKATEGLEGFSANVLFVVEDTFLNERTMRRGRLLYETKAPKTIGILFDHVIIDRRKSEEKRDFVFSERWFVEKNYDEKLFTKRQIARPGETFDPFKLGEGPFPLPIGQSREEVKRRFEVLMIDIPESGPLARLKDGDPVDGLRLIPREEAGLPDEIDRIDVYYDQASGLPVGVVVVENDGDRVKTARLDELVRNPTFTDDERSRLTIEAPAAGWHVDVR